MFRTLSVILMLSASAALAQMQCENLKTLKLADTTITAAELVAAGPYQPQGRGGAQGTPVDLPEHCRVAAVLAPSEDSHIEMELWLPTGASWNGKYEAVGGGGWAGSISLTAMAGALKEGYATSSTDTGHKGGTGMFALGHPEKIVDFGYRAIHDMTVQSKALAEKFYGSPARLSYFNGCSTGGRQALMEAQRFPTDFDGIIAGAPANEHLRLHAASTARTIDIINIPGDHALTRAKQDYLNQRVLEACDALDGIRDGLLNDPRKCHFDPAELLCQGADSDTCLTGPQIAAVKRMYADTKTSDGEIVWTGYMRGSEAGLGVIGTATQPGGGLDSIRILGYQDADWDWHQFDLDRDLAVAVEKAGFIDAGNPNLSEFKAHGGKLLLYHGWSDQAIPPGHTINYYQEVLDTMGASQDDWMRLFMMPGMMHCRGGPGPNQFNYLGAMERWRESGQAPDQLVGNHVSGSTVDMSRPVCPYPAEAKYNGVGSTNDAANFSCQVP